MADLPYGITLDVGKTNPALLPAQTVTNLQGIGSGVWLRYQFRWKQIETSAGVYDWSHVDYAVQACNAAGINYLAVIQDCPDFYASINPSTGADIWPSTQTNYLPNAANTAAFAQVFSQRYAAGSANGVVQAFQIGNEEWANVSSGNYTNQGTYLAPVVTAAFPVIRANCPAIPIGWCAVRKTQTNALANINSWLAGLYQTFQALSFSPSGVYFQDAHYYRNPVTGPGPDPTTSDSNVPSIGQVINALLTQPELYGYTPRAACLETGWDVVHSVNDTYFTDTSPVTLAQARDYAMAMLNQCRALGAWKCFFYTDLTSNVWTNTTLPYSSGNSTATACTVATNTKSMSATVGGVYQTFPEYSDPANTGWKEYAALYPAWPGKFGAGFFHT